MKNQYPLKNLFELGEHSKLFPGKESLDLDASKRSEIDPCLRSLELTKNDKKILKDELKGILKISPYQEGLSIASTSFIGFANFENFSVTVKPKVLISPENLFGMINYAFEFDLKKLPEFSPKTDENYLVDIIIFSFIQQCKELFKKGIFKSYVTHQENGSFFRGKLLIKQHIQNVLKNKPEFACEFDELEYDNLENQIILFCLKRSYQLTKMVELRKEIRKLIFQLTSVVSDKYVSIEDFNKLHYHRQNDYYLHIHDLCKMILESSGIIDFYSDRKHLLNAFFIDMNLIFEKFVANLFKEIFSSRYRINEQRKRKVWNFNDEYTKSIRTDILLHDKKSSKKIVIDTKYKDHLGVSDLYQIGFYIYEYSDKTSLKKIGFAILPTSKILGIEGKQSPITSIKENTTIMRTYLNIDQIVPLLYDKNPGKITELRKRVESLLVSN